MALVPRCGWRPHPDVHVPDTRLQHNHTGAPHSVCFTINLTQFSNTIKDVLLARGGSVGHSDDAILEEAGASDSTGVGHDRLRGFRSP